MSLTMPATPPTSERRQPLGPRLAHWPVDLAGPAAVLAVLALAALLRMFNLLSLPLYTDEAIYLHWARDIWEQRTRTALLIPISDDGKQPLFMWVAGGAMQLIGDPLLAGRTVCALAGLTATIGAYLLGRHFAGHKVGLTAALLYAVTPFTLFFDRMAFVDGLVSVEALWVLVLGVLMAAGERKLDATALFGLTLGIVLAAALWTKMTALFLLPIPLLCVLLVQRRGGHTSFAVGIAVAYTVLAASGVALALMPNARNLVDKTSYFSLSFPELLTFPTSLWLANASAYWTWIQTYLPAPLCWIVLASVPWTVAVRRRRALLLIGCWVACTLPPMLTAKTIFMTRYVLPGVFPLLLLTAEPMARGLGWVYARAAGLLPASKGISKWGWAASGLVLLGIISPSLAFDQRLLTDPSSAGLVESDQGCINGWDSGYGFAEAVALVRERATQLNQDVIVLSDHYHGLPYDGLSLYLRGIPKVHFYVDGHLLSGGTGILEAWRPHQVPLLIVGNDGRDNLKDFERNVPEAKRIGIFWKPGGHYSFRVYEIGLASLQGIGPGNSESKGVGTGR